MAQRFGVHDLHVWFDPQHCTVQQEPLRLIPKFRAHKSLQLLPGVAPKLEK